MVRIVFRGAGSTGPPPRIGRKTLVLLCCLPLAAVAVGVALKHGGGNGAQAAAPPSKTPACAHVQKKAIARPAAVPAAVLPPGTVLTSVDRPVHGMTLVTGVVPQQFSAAVQFFVTKMPAAGYLNGIGDAEMDEAEAVFSGRGVQGKWKVNGIINCPNAVTLVLFVRT
jgi:hypothetical protein